MSQSVHDVGALDLPVLPSMRLDGVAALVTGASRGLGLAAAAGLAQAGARVTIAARSMEALERAADAIRARGGRCEVLQLDVTKPAEVEAAIAAREPFQVLVNNAGINRPKALVDTPDEDIDDILTLNVKSAVYVSRAVARQLLAARLSGSIINVSSQMGLVGSQNRTLYCASKHALEGMTKALAWELGAHSIRVNTVCPTFIETDLTASMFAQAGFREWVTSRIALGRPGRMEEIMGPVLFLASDASSLMTGAALVIDGGWTAA